MSWNDNLLAKNYTYYSQDSFGNLHGSNVSQAKANAIAAANNPSNYDLLSDIQSINDANTAKSQELAERQMQFQTQSNAKAMEYNAEQAQINRDFQERLANTAHQREIADLQAAGLNPVLSANHSGSATPSGSAASGVSSSGASGTVSTAYADVLSNFLTSSLNAATTITKAGIDADNALRIAQANNATSIKTAGISRQASAYSANMAYNSAQNVQAMKNAQEVYMAQNYPQNWFGVVESLFHSLFGDGKKDGVVPVITGVANQAKDTSRYAPYGNSSVK